MEEFRKKYRGVLLVLCLLFVSWVLITLTLETENAYGADTELGKKVYESRCTICHGSKGSGNGAIGIIDKDKKSGRVWTIYPRDFTIGVFKFRTTPTGCLPVDKDILGIIKNGISRSGMPSHKDIPSKEMDAVTAYLKTLSERWEEEDLCEPIAAKKPEWVGRSASVEKGKKIYEEMKCWECHGYDGKGNGPKSNELKDDWGKPIWPFNFTTGELKRGSSSENIYITFTTGLDGTGMPSYEDSLNEEDRWHLVSYTLKLMKKVK